MADSDGDEEAQQFFFELGCFSGQERSRSKGMEEL